jgi:type 1 fimbria pilin
MNTKNGLNLNPKFFQTSKLTFNSMLVGITIVSLVLMSGLTVFAQKSKEQPKIVPFEKLTNEILPIPKELGLVDFSGFDFRLNSISKEIINLYNQDNVKQAEIVIQENILKKSVIYKIRTKSKWEWVEVTTQSIADKEISNAKTSSGKTFQIALTKSSKPSDCPDKTAISAIETTNQFGVSKATEFSSTSFKKDFKDLVIQSDDVLYDTQNLKLLKSVVLNQAEFLKVALEATKETTKNILEGNNLVEAPAQNIIPDCDVFCVRLGTIINVYLCNDNTFNCSRCGASGFYFISAGCFAICRIRCSAFYA